MHPYFLFIIFVWLSSLSIQTTWCPCCALSCAYSGSSASLSVCGGPVSGEKSARGGSACPWRGASTTSGNRWGPWRGRCTRTTETRSTSAPSSWAPRIGPAQAGRMRRRWRRKSWSWWKRWASLPSKSTLNLQRGPRTGWSAPRWAAEAAEASLPSKQPTWQASAQRTTTVKMSITPPLAKSTKITAYELRRAGRGDQGHLRNKDWVFPHVFFFYFFWSWLCGKFLLFLFLCTKEASFCFFIKRRWEALLCFRRKKTAGLGAGLRNSWEKPYKDFYVVVYKWLCFWFCFEWPNFGADHVRGVGDAGFGDPPSTVHLFSFHACLTELVVHEEGYRAYKVALFFSVLSVVLAERSLKNGLQYFESVASAFGQAPRFQGLLTR